MSRILVLLAVFAVLAVALSLVGRRSASGCGKNCGCRTPRPCNDPPSPHS